jgi:hypothetical protein
MIRLLSRAAERTADRTMVRAVAGTGSWDRCDA